MTTLYNIRVAPRLVELEFPNNEVSRLFIEFEPKNELFHIGGPVATLDGTIHNDGAAFYRPQISFKLNYNNEQEFRDLIQRINRNSFVIDYFDVELGQRVIRKMQLDDVSKRYLIDVQNNLRGVVDIECNMTSVFSYAATDRQGRDIGYANLLILDTRIT